MSATWFDSITITVEIAFTSAPFAVTPTWVDVTSYVRQISIKRGDPDETHGGGYAASLAMIELDNRLRTFDPDYASNISPGNLLPGKRVRVTAYHAASGITSRRYTGFVDDWPQSYVLPSDATVRLECVDLTEALSQATYTPPDTTVQRSTGTMIGLVLDAVGWPSAERAISPGDAVATFSTTDPVPALDLIREIESTEQGRFFIAGDGKATFRSRAWALTDSEAVSTPAVWGDLPGGVELPYVSLLPDGQARYVANDVTVGTANAQDATSQTAYRRRSMTIEGTWTRAEEQASLAAFVLSRRKDIRRRVKSMGIRPRSNPALLFPHVLAADIGHFQQIRRRPQNVGSAVTFDVTVESITETITPDNWLVSWGFAPSVLLGQTFSTYDDATYDDRSYAP